MGTRVSTHGGNIRRANRIRAVGRTTATLLVVAAVAAASFVILGHALIRPQFDRLERERAQTELLDVQKHVNSEVKQIDATAQQNSNWTGLYDEMTHGAGPFLQENLGDTAAHDAGLSVDLVAYDSGRIAFESTYDWNAQRTAAHPLISPTANIRELASLRQAFAGKTTVGVFDFSGRMALVSARPIVRSNGSGGGRGVVVFARELDRPWLQTASDELHATVSIDSLSGTGVSSSDAVVLSGDTVRATTNLMGSGNRPVATVHVVSTSELRALADETIRDLTFFATLVIVAGATALIIAVTTTARRQSDRFHSVVQNTKDVIILSDKRGTITYASPSALAVFGHHPSALVGLPLTDWVQPDDGFDPEFAAWRAPDGDGAQLMLRFRRADGTSALCEGYRANMLNEPGVRSIILNLHDITDRAHASDQIVKARDEAVRAMNVKSQFLASMSHEVRTPLNGVLGLTELLLSTPLDSEQMKYATSAHSAAENLLSIVNDILDFSKMEAGKLNVEAAQLDAVDLVNEVAALLAPQARAKGVRLETQTDGALSTAVRGDPLRLRQVLLNLAGNALKFTDAGVVTLAVRVLAVNEQSVSMRFEVADTGIGISAEDQDRIFGAFAQADSSTTRRYGGTGLGLAISRQLVQAMGSDLRVVSDVGCGSTFSFEITLAKDATAPSRTSETDEPARAGGEHVYSGRVLLVEDTEVNQLVASRMLTKLGFEVDVARNGVEALDAVRSNPYALVFMDCQMPVMDGYEATRQLRRQERDAGSTPRLPVIAMTAAAMAGDRERCLHAGMDDYLSKPLTIAALRALIDRLGARTSFEEPLGIETAAPAPTVIDPDRVAELRELDTADGTVVERLIGAFLETANTQIERLHEAVREGNPEAVERAAHALKGSSGNIGAIQLADLAGRLERLARGRALGDADAKVTEIAEEMTRVAYVLPDALRM
jgi:PAS domain S-box-containing protein